MAPVGELRAVLPRGFGWSEAIPQEALQSIITVTAEEGLPFLCTVYFVATLSWTLLAVVHLVELRRYSPGSSWTTRFAVTFITSAQLAKLHLVLQQHDRRNYFFVLFIVYVAVQVSSVPHMPCKQFLKLCLHQVWQ